MSCSMNAGLGPSRPVCHRGVLLVFNDPPCLLPSQGKLSVLFEHVDWAVTATLSALWDPEASSEGASVGTSRRTSVSPVSPAPSSLLFYSEGSTV